MHPLDRILVGSHWFSGSSFSILLRRSWAHSFTPKTRNSFPTCIFLTLLFFVKYVDADLFAVITGMGDHGVPGHTR